MVPPKSATPAPRRGCTFCTNSPQKCTATASRTRLHPGGMVTGDLLADLSWRLNRHWRGRRDLDLAWFAQIEPRYRAARAAARDGLPQFNLDPVRLQSKKRVPLLIEAQQTAPLGPFCSEPFERLKIPTAPWHQGKGNQPTASSGSTGKLHLIQALVSLSCSRTISLLDP